MNDNSPRNAPEMPPADGYTMMVIDPRGPQIGFSNGLKVGEKITYDLLKRLFKEEGMPETFIEAVALSEGVTMWLDEEGFLTDQSKQRFFSFVSTKTLFAGPAIVLFTEEHDGDSYVKEIPSWVVTDVFNGYKPVDFYMPEEAERAIRRNRVKRPGSYFFSGKDALDPDKVDEKNRETLWEWSYPLPEDNHGKPLH